MNRKPISVIVDMRLVDVGHAIIINIGIREVTVARASKPDSRETTWTINAQAARVDLVDTDLANRGEKVLDVSARAGNHL